MASEDELYRGNWKWFVWMPTSGFLLRTLLVGILATFTMDVLGIAATKLGLIAPLPPRLMGRWFASVFRGRPFHGDIAQESPVANEMALALPAHYAIGVALAFLFVLATSALGLSPRNPITAFGFALCTNALPWLVMFPAMGYGWFGLRGPAGTRLLLSSFVTHVFYGAGLWIAALIVPR